MVDDLPLAPAALTFLPPTVTSGAFGAFMPDVSPRAVTVGVPGISPSFGSGLGLGAWGSGAAWGFGFTGAACCGEVGVKF